MPEIQETPQARLSRRSVHLSKSFFKYALSSICAATLGILVANPVWNWWSGPSAYKIYIVGDFRAGQGGGEQIKNGFLERGQAGLKVDRVNVEIELKDHENDERLSQAISAEIAASNDALLVVGHFSSTQTKAGLANYMKANPPIPVVLAAETNPYLYGGPTGQMDGDEVLPVLRLPPTDEQQAARGAAFALERKASTFWVIEDANNPVYSKYLANEFIRNVQDKKGSIIFWSNSAALPSLDTFRALKPNCVFFAGSAPNALILVRQLRAFSKTASLPMPMVLLTDSAVDTKVIASDNPDLDGIYLIYPWLASESAKADEGSRVIGRDARIVCDGVLEAAVQKLSNGNGQKWSLGRWLRARVGMHRVKDARGALLQVVQHSIRQGIIYGLSNGRKAQFTASMRNRLAQFHIWSVARKQFYDVPEPHGL